MAEAVESSRWQRLRGTSMRDLLRGRLTARMDWRARLQQAALPALAAALVSEVIGRTRLWRGEQAEIADELIAHFRDGLAQGTAAQELVDRFGDVPTAARLIRRAKMRNRPLAWRSLGVAVRTLEGVLVVHLLLAARFYAGKPAAVVDYAAQLNAPTLATPFEQRAMPLYLQAIDNTCDFKSTLVNGIPSPKPGDAAWIAIAAYLQAHEVALQQVRTAAARPSLGGIWLQRDSGSGLFPRALQNGWPLARLSLLLELDAERAEADGHFRQAIHDVAAEVGMSEQVRVEGMYGSSWNASYSRGEALTITSDLLTRHAGQLSDGDLRDLAHLISRLPASMQAAFDLHAMPLIEAHYLQLMYTTGADGTGRLTEQGMAMAGPYLGPMFQSRAWAVPFLAGPACMLLAHNPQQTMAKYQAMLDQVMAAMSEPLASVPPEQTPEPWQAVRSSSLQAFEYPAVPLAQVWLRGVRESTAAAIGKRDGLLVGLALEAYHRQHGGYPDELQALAPDLLPAIPVDPFTGEPGWMRYRQIDGHPVVYAFGRDGKDHGGHPPLRLGQPDYGASYSPAGGALTPGDWILFPVHRPG